MVGPSVHVKDEENHCSNRVFAEPLVKNEFSNVTVKKEPKESEDRLQICRVCLKEGTIPIFGDDTSENLAEDLSTMASIEINLQDEFPKYLCQNCHSLLQAALMLRKTAQESDITLRTTNFLVREPKKEKKKGRKTKGYRCNDCDLDFKTLKDYNNHKQSEGHESEKIQCPQCDKLLTPKYLKRHIAFLHKPETCTSYICDICGKDFIIQRHFKRHRVTHFFDLPFKCTLCPYRGRFAEALKMHMRSHTGDRPYQCSECPSRFISKSNLNKHALTHKSEFDFKCETCGKGFYKKNDMELHIKVDHTGVKDHICNVCGKAFGYRKHMMKHQRQVHKREKMRGGIMPVYLQAAAKNIAIEDS